MVVKLEFTNKIGKKYDWLLHTRLDAVLNIVGLGYFGENRIKVEYLIHILQWNGIHLKKKKKWNSLFLTYFVITQNFLW